nr:hypothetical protein [Nannocystis pusilla]
MARRTCPEAQQAARLAGAPRSADGRRRRMRARPPGEMPQVTPRARPRRREAEALAHEGHVGLLRGLAAGAHQRDDVGGGDVAQAVALVGGGGEDDVGDVLGRGQPPVAAQALEHGAGVGEEGGVVGQVGGVNGLLAGALAESRGEHAAGLDQLHADALRRELPREPLGETFDGELAGRVERAGREREHAGAGGDVDDHAAALAAEVWQDGAGRRHQAEHVDVELLAGLGRAGGLEQPEQAEAGVVDEGVEAAEAVEAGGDGGVDAGRVLHVEVGDEDAGEVAQLGLAGGRAHAGDDVPAGAGEAVDGGAAEAGRGAGDEDGASHGPRSSPRGRWRQSVRSAMH